MSKTRLYSMTAWHKWSLRIETPYRAVYCALCKARIPKGTRTGRRVSGAWWRAWKCHFICPKCTLDILDDLIPYLEGMEHELERSNRD